MPALGALTTVRNEGLRSNLESRTLVVGWISVDGDVRAMAFTERELDRPFDRANDNCEDLLPLKAKPPTHHDLDRLEYENEQLRTRLRRCQNRGLLARIFNKE